MTPEEPKIGTCSLCEREGRTLPSWGESCEDWEECSSYREAQARASVVGSTIESVETSHTVTTINLSDGRALKVKTCSCCGMEVDVEESSRW